MDRDPTKMTIAELKAVLEAEDNYRSAELLGHSFSWRADAEGNIIYVSPHWDQAMGFGFHDAVANGGLMKSLHKGEEIGDIWQRCVASGEVYSVLFRYVPINGANPVWIKSMAKARHNSDGKIVRWYGMAENVTETYDLLTKQEALVQELNHRVKNSLATVQSIVLQTFRSLREEDGYNIHAYEVFCDKVMARLQTLASAHDLLTQNLWTGTDLNSVLEHTLVAIMDERRFSISGPSIGLNPNAALLMAMIFHELGTNAIKYGAWSNTGGRVNVGWAIDGETISLVWKEMGGPEVKEPTRKGFGTKLITRGGLNELQGRTELVFDPNGVQCRLEFKVSGKVWLRDKNTAA